MEESPWMILPEAAEYCRQSADTIRRWIRDGVLKAYKPKGKLLFKREDLDRTISMFPVYNHLAEKYEPQPKTRPRKLKGYVVFRGGKKK